jgi:hypothetical protein
MNFPPVGKGRLGGILRWYLEGHAQCPEGTLEPSKFLSNLLPLDGGGLRRGWTFEYPLTSILSPGGEKRYL